MVEGGGEGIETLDVDDEYSADTGGSCCCGLLYVLLGHGAGKTSRTAENADVEDEW